MNIKASQLKKDEEIQYYYDERKRVIAVINPLDPTSEVTYEYELLDDGSEMQKEYVHYDSEDNYVEEGILDEIKVYKDNLLIKEDNLQGEVKEYFYNENRKLVKCVSKDSLLENEYKDNKPIKSTYSEKDENNEMYIRREGEFAIDGSEYFEKRYSPEIGHHDEVKTLISHVYNELGLLVKTTDFEYFATREYYYDNDKRLIIEKNNSRDRSEETEYQYDKNGNVIKETTVGSDGLIDVCEFFYNDDGLLIKRVSYSGYMVVKPGYPTN